MVELKKQAEYIAEKVNQAFQGGFKAGYEVSLGDLKAELDIKLADGFVIDSTIVGELLEMLKEKNKTHGTGK